MVSCQRTFFFSDEARILFSDTRDPIYFRKVTVWYAFWSGGVIEPYCFDDDEGHIETVNGKRYWLMLTDYFWHEKVCIDIRHKTREVQSSHYFTSGDVNWQHRSCYLTPLHLFVVLSRIYINKLSTLEHLKTNTR